MSKPKKITYLELIHMIVDGAHPNYILYGGNFYMWDGHNYSLHPRSSNYVMNTLVSSISEDDYAKKKCITPLYYEEEEEDVVEEKKEDRETV